MGLYDRDYARNPANPPARPTSTTPRVTSKSPPWERPSNASTSSAGPTARSPYIPSAKPAPRGLTDAAKERAAVVAIVVFILAVVALVVFVR